MTEIFPGWKLNVDETSNGVYLATLTDTFGRIASARGDDSVFDQVRGYAFDIEKQVSRNFSHFLYDLTLVELAKSVIIETDRLEANGSWSVELADRKIVYNGRDRLLIRQINPGEWDNEMILTESALNYSNFVGLIGT